MSPKNITKIADMSEEQKKSYESINHDEFIDQVQLYPFLFKSNVSGFKDKNKKERALKAIESTLQIESKCKIDSKWIIIQV